ncbi:M23 family metallopeptidase [Acinetobacter haemolyticus]|uniref:M23 family metallopeptidase n=1 Tax=Acinetobacter haemolyticus TaxID=29430 RepID=UPI000D699066|nr:M23 family metallopeptidase [Acinetobacter haemolyticus]
MPYSEEFKNFVGTVAGEAGGCSPTTWKVVAHCIVNRVGFAEWVNARNVSDILKKNFDAITDQNAPFLKAVSEMNKGILSKNTQDIIDAVYPIYERVEDDFTNGVVLYFSPKAQAALHRRNPNKYKSLVPDFAKSSLTEEVKIKGTENDDMRWYRYKGASRFYCKFIDTSAKALSGAVINISYRNTKNVPSLSNLITNNDGEIRSVLVADGWGARFSVDEISVKDDKGKELMLIADGKNHSAVIVVNNGKGGIKSRTDVHNQEPTAPQQKPLENSSNQGQKDNPNSSSEKRDIIFNIKIVDSDNRPIPNMAYFLRYKGNDKKHVVGSDGIERNIIAESGEILAVEISGKDTRQVIKSFTASSGVLEQTVKFELHCFEIMFRHQNSRKPISNLNLIQTYRGRTYEKKTNDEGKILVKAMPGFELNYKLRNGRNLLTLNVDKNKDLRIIDVDSNAIEKAAESLKKSVDASKQQNQSTSAAVPESKQEVKIQDQTSKRDKITATSTDGHPKTIVNDHGDVEFVVLTYDKETNQLFNGGSYIIEYKGNKRLHVSGTHGLGKKSHKGQIGQTIKILDSSGNNHVLYNVLLRSPMSSIELKIDKPKDDGRYLYPLKTSQKTNSYKSGAGRFGSNRGGGKRKHAGCDLYAPTGTEVRAMADGKVRLVAGFYAGTDVIEIVHEKHIIRYGEVLSGKSLVKAGDNVRRGQLIGYVGQLSIKVPSMMLHLEMYANPSDTSALTVRGANAYQRRTDLIDPTLILDNSIL